MPKENTHIYLAQEIFKTIKNPDIKKIIKDNFYLYQIGSFSPDIFSYGKTKDIVKISKDIHGFNHQKTNIIVFKILNKIKNTPNKKENLAFLFGFLTHLATDITFHPWIYYFTGNAGKSIDSLYRHVAFETGLDKFFNKKVNIPQVNKNKINQLVFLKILEKKYSIPSNKLIKNYQRQFWFTRLFKIDSAYILLNFLNSINLFKQKDKLGLFYANNLYPLNYFKKKFDYQNPVDGKKENTQTKDLVKQTKNLADIYISTAYNYYLKKINKETAEKNIKGENLSTGKLNYVANDMKFFNKKLQTP